MSRAESAKRGRSPEAAGSSKAAKRRDQPTGEPAWGNVATEEEYEAERKRESGEDVREEDKEKPDFGLSGALAKDVVTGNVYNGVVLKWTEPLDASPASKGWRVYVFKGDDLVETLHLHRQSAFLFGREARVADHVLAHPSCSNQHAVIQFRKTSSKGKDGEHPVKQVSKPYLMDLKSTHKTLLNGEKVDDSRFIELRESDVIKFGFSTRDYVLVREKDK